MQSDRHEQKDSSSSSHQRQSEFSHSRVSSLHPECLHNLRFPVSETEGSKKKTHLLAYMSEMIQNREQAKVQELEEFCSFDRIKRIIERKREIQSQINIHGTDLDKERQSERVDEQMIGALQIQAKMKKMEEDLKKSWRPLSSQVQNSQFQKKFKDTKKLSMKCSFPTKSSHHSMKKSSTPTQSKQNNTNSNFFLTCHSVAEQLPQKENLTVSHHLLGRHTIQKQFKANAYEQYNKWQKKKQLDHQNSIKVFIEQEIEKRVENLLEERDIKYNQLLKQNKLKEKRILEKDLQIQNLKSKQEILNKKIEQLQVFRERYSQQSSLKKKGTQKFLQAFHKQFVEVFPNQSIQSLKKQIDNIVGKCLDRFQDVECKNYDKWNGEKQELNQKIERMQGNICKLRNTQNELRNNLKNIRYEQNVSNLQFDALLKSKQELEKLQNKILSIYNEWHSKRAEPQKQVMQSLGLLEGSYEYIEMLDFIGVYRDKFCTDHKVHEYLIKVLRGIERIRKILFPRTDYSETQSKKKKDPISFLEKLEKYIKTKVYQARFKKGQVKNTRMSQIIQQEFLTYPQSEDDIFAQEI